VLPFSFYCASERGRTPESEEDQLSRGASTASVSLTLQVAIQFALEAQPSSFFGFTIRV
jgi:hypothetical protein